VTQRAEAFLGRWPMAWVGFALALFAVPVSTLIVRTGVSFKDFLPTLNASLNATSALLLSAGYVAIRRRKVWLHWRLMLSAFASSTIFLGFYLLRIALTGTHRYPVHDWTRTLYLVVLGSHTLLAMSVPPLAARTLWLAHKGKQPQHRRLARVTLPIWLYVSVTGVLVYVLLYHVAPNR
jgi:putative membrane protein